MSDITIQSQSFSGKDFFPDALAKLIFDAYFYEWNAKENIWTKLVADNPDPPLNLPPGKFDGQIQEVRKESI